MRWCYYCLIMPGSRNFVREVQLNSDTLLLDEWSEESKYHYKRIIISPTAKRWRGDNYSIFNAGLVAFDFTGDLDQYC